MTQAASFTVPALCYQHYDVEAALPTPAQGMGGWQTVDATLSTRHTALVVMHAWQFDHPEQYPGQRRCVEYLARADAITAQVLPRLLAGVRAAGLPVWHVTAAGMAEAQACPGFAYAKQVRREMLGDVVTPVRPRPAADPCFQALGALRRARGYPGAHNEADCRRGMADARFPPIARPMDDEPVCETADELLACCLARGVNHLIYVGFALNWCLLMSPGGMLEMSERGLMCSTIREAVTAVENRESAADELHKEEALWRVSLRFGLVFALEPLLTGLARLAHSSGTG